MGHANQGSTGGKMLKLLLNHGASVKGTGGLIPAAEVGNVEAVEMILDLRCEEMHLAGEGGGARGLRWT